MLPIQYVDFKHLSATLPIKKPPDLCESQVIAKSDGLSISTFEPKGIKHSNEHTFVQMQKER